MGGVAEERKMDCDGENVFLVVLSVETKLAKIFPHVKIQHAIFQSQPAAATLN